MFPLRVRRALPLTAMAMRLALIVALVAAAFAHRPAGPAPSGMSAFQLAQYTLPDGTLPVFCLPGEDRAASGAVCEFCLIAGGAMPPARAPAPRAWAHDGATLSAFPVRAEPSIRPVRHGTASPRGPPGASSDPVQKRQMMRAAAPATPARRH